MPTPHIRSYALSMGISPSRLHFTGSASLDDHIAYKSAAVGPQTIKILHQDLMLGTEIPDPKPLTPNHKSCVQDLMLDTDTYNAHSTAADTLWAGVPVLTMASTRMAGDWGASSRGLWSGQHSVGFRVYGQGLGNSGASSRGLWSGHHSVRSRGLGFGHPECLKHLRSMVNGLGTTLAGDSALMRFGICLLFAQGG